MVRRADPETIAKCRAILEEMKTRPPGELFADMIARGIINERGQVLYGDEKPSKAPRKSSGSTTSLKKRTKNKSANGKSSNGKHS